MGSTLIGETVESLRDLCTGQVPVHFFRKLASSVAVFALAIGIIGSVFLDTIS